METMRNIEFIEKSSLFHSYKKILCFGDFDLLNFFSVSTFVELNEPYRTI